MALCHVIPVVFIVLLAVTGFGSGSQYEKKETALSIAITPEDPPEGYAFSITGLLTDGDGSPLGNKRVALEVSPDGDPAYPYEHVAVDATDREGRYDFFRGNYTPAEFIRVRYAGNEVYLGSVSRSIAVRGAENFTNGTHPSRNTGGLMLTGDPDNSLVMLDGVLRGMTPLALNGIEAGPHILEIGKPGFQNQTMEVFVSPDMRTTFSFSLPPEGSERAGISSATGLAVFSNTSYTSDESEPLGDPVYSFSQAGISVDIYGNNSTVQGTNNTQITTMYDEHPFGDGFSLSVIITSDDTPFR